MRTEKEIRDLYNKILNELKPPITELEKYYEWTITTPTERMLKIERLDMIKAIFEWVLEEKSNG